MISYITTCGNFTIYGLDVVGDKDEQVTLRSKVKVTVRQCTFPVKAY